MKALGKHLIAELYECDKEVLNDENFLEHIMIEAVAISGATFVKSVFHQFSPHGVTGIIVVAESHFAIHTWPEYGYCAVDIFTCGDLIDSDKSLQFLKEKLHSQNFSVSEIKRGLFDGEINHKPLK